MIVGICELRLHLPEATSLKHKRSVIKSMITRMRQKFNVSAAEVGDNDLWQSALIGIVMATNSTAHADQTLNNVMKWIEDNFPQVMIIQESVEII